MSILQEILKWTGEVPLWQSDATARLLLKQDILQSDIEDLFALLKTEHGIPDPENRIAKPLMPDQIPVPIQDTSSVILLAMKDLHNINAIAENQYMPFGQTGLTVIYGDNGSGKSGYSRVLKRACRARDQSEKIYPNANLPVVEGKVAKASFEVLVNGDIQNLTWVNGEIAPAELSSIAIFDTHCAQAYLDNEDDFSFVPFGLDIYERLAKVFNELKSKIEAEQAQFSVDLTVFAHLQDDTTVGKLIRCLSSKTSIAEITALATLDGEEKNQLIDLEKSLKENNPKEKAVQLQLFNSRINAIKENIISKSLLVEPAVVSKFRKLDENLCIAQDAALLTTQNFKDSEDFLPGTGGKAWRELFEKARQFSLESYPNKTFPDLGDDSRCPLCQQTLMEGSLRLKQFDAFVQQETEKNVQVCKTALRLEYDLFIKSVMTLNIDDITYDEIESFNPQLVKAIQSFEQALVTRYNAIKDAFVSHKWDNLETEIMMPLDLIQSQIDRLKTEIETLQKVSTDETRDQLQAKFNELAARRSLSHIQHAVVEAVSRLSHEEKLKKCLIAVKTNALTRKASDLSENLVSKELVEALNHEFKALGVGTLKVALQSRSSRGKALHKLKLELPQNINPSNILSEGEQRAIAIGSFLAEVGLSGSSGGVVFDDPVSSLDHRRRELVAKRLVEEATRRQVILFTHDIYFLCVLTEAAKLADVPTVTQQLTRQPEGFGTVHSDLPFEGKSTSKRISALKAQHQEIARLYKICDEEACRLKTITAYTQLRMAWERAVEEVLFRSVVVRFGKGISTQRLAEVIVDDDDYAQVNIGMTQCSNYAHDKASEGGIAVPDPDQLLKDIIALDEWRSNIETRSKETQKRRKK